MASSRAGDRAARAAAQPRGGANPWLGRFAARRTIRRLGAIEHVACRDQVSGEPRVVIVTTEGAPEVAHALVAEMARLHALVDSPLVPRTDHAGRHGEQSYVALRCDAVADLRDVGAVGLELGIPIVHGEGVVFALECAEALRVAHRTHDPVRGGPVCMGAFSDANVLLSPDGRFHLVGFGQPTTTAERERLLPHGAPFYAAFEASFGEAATPASDVNAFGYYLNSLWRFGRLPEAVEQAVGGSGGQGLAAAMSQLTRPPPDAPGEMAALAERTGRMLRSVLAHDPRERSLDAFVRELEAVLDLLGIVPDPEGLRRKMALGVAEWSRRVGGRRTLRVPPSRLWFQLDDGERVDLAKRGAMRLMFSALVEHRLVAPDTPMSLDALLEAGWPGQQILPQAASNRVHVALSSLRKLGLREVLVSRNDGYLLEAAVDIVEDAG